MSSEPPGPDGEPPRPLLRTFLALGVVLFAGIVLVWGRAILVPVAQAIFFWFILNALASGMRRLPVLGPRIPWGAAVAGAAALLLVLGYLAVENSVRMAASLGTDAAGLQRAFDPLVTRLATASGLAEEEILNRVVDRVGLEALLGRIALGVVAFANTLGIVAIYVGFLLADQRYFESKLAALAPDEARRDRIRALLVRIGGGIQTYLWILTVVSALTAGLSYPIMRVVGLEHAGFLALVIFLLNYIPTIGSILGAVVPTAFALLQFQELGPALVVLAGVGAVQFVIGNILLPRLSGDTLNISLFVTILALFLWGALWGVTGMFLAVPITAALIIVLSNFEATRPLAIMLSRTGRFELPEARSDEGGKR